MKSEWRVTTNIINGEHMYAVYRLIDITAVDHSGNREYASEYTRDKPTALALAEELNNSKKEAD